MTAHEIAGHTTTCRRHGQYIKTAERCPVCEHKVYRLAKFDGQCRLCEQPIKIGQRIVPVPESEGDGWEHLECPDSTDELADRLALAQPLCTRCMTRHPGEC